jgi:hypothetical protein
MLPLAGEEEKKPKVEQEERHFVHASLAAGCAGNQDHLAHVLARGDHAVGLGRPVERDRGVHDGSDRPVGQCLAPTDRRAR